MHESWHENWEIVPNFPQYEVSDRARFRNRETGRIMILTPNQFGDLTVGFTLEGKQYRRSAKVVVARAFCLGEDEKFNTAMLLDGDKNNILPYNIVWRPRWLAWEYHRQFTNQPIWYFHGPIVDRAGNEYGSIFEAAIMIGSLCSHIRQSIHNGTKVFPGGEIFRFKKGDSYSK